MNAPSGKTILGIDLGLKCGFAALSVALGREPEVIDIWTVDCNRRKGRKTVADDPEGYQFMTVGSAMAQAIQRYTPFHIEFEEPGRMQSDRAAKSVYGMRGVLLALTAVNGVPQSTVYPTRLKKWASGKGDMKKEDLRPRILALVRSLRYHGSTPLEQLDHNALDAVTIALYGAAALGYYR